MDRGWAFSIVLHFASCVFVFASCCVRFLRPAVIACAACCFLRVLKEKGEPRGENDHGAFPLVSLGQMSAAGRTHDPRFSRSVLN